MCVCVFTSGYKQDLALNYSQGFICHLSQINQLIENAFSDWNTKIFSLYLEI